MNIDTFFTVLIVGLLIVLSPGPQWFITIKHSIHSRKHGLAFINQNNK
ncbi:hypothetical protein [Geomicrobium sediminis]|uniref:Threonine/homoserine/homoserine lactone efflux protein n=1 Tax=Geomicrobium sediminis TaxID=1347788 RepID=A0ABS2PAE6_9BACL|nr:hypothetical protein [Geomicrobium sediminis]MBM7632392.1 threonine/homoserine/homoserine lactone efflux protein [Geomicrobium sediminis]